MRSALLSAAADGLPEAADANCDEGEAASAVDRSLAGVDMCECAELDARLRTEGQSLFLSIKRVGSKPPANFRGTICKREFSVCGRLRTFP